jgi:5'-nucleotidase
MGPGPAIFPAVKLASTDANGEFAWTMMIVATNDDGIEADGLQALEKAARTLPGARVIVVAPATEQSQCGHRVTTREPLVVESRGVDRHAVHGTPADCVRVALFGLGLQPDLILSGINHGGNMGQDLVISGTVAAAREAAYHGIPAIAFSHYLIRERALEWTRVIDWTRHLLHLMHGEGLTAGTFHNVNFPHLPSGESRLPEIVPTQPARSPLNVEFAITEPQGTPQVTEFFYTASYAGRPRDPGSDVEATFNDHISWSRLGL